MEVSSVRTRALLVLAALAGLLLGPAAPAWAVGPSGGPRAAGPDTTSSSSARAGAGTVVRVQRERAGAPAQAASVDLVSGAVAGSAGPAGASAAWIGGTVALGAPAGWATLRTAVLDRSEGVAAPFAQGRAPPRTTGT